MKQRRYTSNTMLAGVLGIALVVCILLRSFAPAVILPKPGIPNLVLLSLVALLIAHYLKKGKQTCDVLTALLAAVTFGVLPYVSGFATLPEAGKLALCGGIVFFLTAWLFGQAMDRLTTGPAAKAAPVLTAFGLYLASQCFAGML